MIGRRGTASRAVGAAVAVAALLTAGTARPASAHTVGGVSPTNYRSELAGVVPGRRGIEARLLDLGRRVRLTNRTPADVVVLGYQGEPYLRVGPGGTFENRRSPAVYANRVLPAGTTSTNLPPQADASAPPQWQRVSASRTVAWRDRRTRWEGPAPAVVAQARRATHVVVPRWFIELRQGGDRLLLEGDIRWVPPPSPAPWLLVGLAVLGLTGASVGARRWGPFLAGVVSLVVAADVARNVGGAAVSDGSFGAQLVRFAGLAFFPAIGWVAGIAAVGPLQRGNEAAAVAAGLAGFLVAASAIGDATSLVRSQVPSVLPASLARAAIVVVSSAGLGLVAAAVVVVRRAARASPATAG